MMKKKKVYNYLTIKVFVYPFGESFCAVYRPVLSSCTAKTDGQAGKVAFQILGYGGTNHLLGCSKEILYCLVPFEELYHGAVFAGVGFELGVATRVRQCPTVEDMAAAVARIVHRESLLVAEGGDGDGEGV